MSSSSSSLSSPCPLVRSLLSSFSSASAEFSDSTSIGLEAEGERKRFCPAVFVAPLRLAAAEGRTVVVAAVSLWSSFCATTLLSATRVGGTARLRVGGAAALLDAAPLVCKDWRWLPPLFIQPGALHGGCSRETRWCGRRSSAQLVVIPVGATATVTRPSSGCRGVSSPRFAV